MNLPKTVAQADTLTLSVFNKTLSQMNDTVQDSNITGEEQNQIINALSNKLIRQIVEDSFNLKSEIVDMFAVPGMNVSEGEQIIENDLIASTDYNETDWVPSGKQEHKILQMFLHTKDKKVWNIQINKSILAAAFTGVPAFNSFVQNLLSQITKSMTLYIYENLLADLDNNIKTTYTATTVDKDKDPEGYSPLQQGITQFFDLVENATDVPTRDFNLDGRARKVVFTGIEDMIILANPTTLNNVSTKALAKIFNSERLDIVKKIKTLKVSGIPAGQLIYMDRKAYRIYKRIEEMSSQYYNRPMKFDWVLHLWLVRGVVNWKTGFKFILQTPKTVSANLGYSGDLKNNGTNGFTGVEINLTLNNKADFKMKDHDWVLVRIINQDGDIIKDLLYNNTGTRSSGPDDLQTDCETFKVSDILTTGYKFTKTDESLTSVPETGIYQVQAFANFTADNVPVSSTSTTPTSIKKV